MMKPMVRTSSAAAVKYASRDKTLHRISFPHCPSQSSLQSLTHSLTHSFFKKRTQPFKFIPIINPHVIPTTPSAAARIRRRRLLTQSVNESGGALTAFVAKVGIVYTKEVRGCVLVCVCVCVCVRVRVHTHAYTYVCACVCVLLYVCMYICTYAFVCESA